MSGPLLEVEHLRTVLTGSNGPVHAVDDISFAIAPGETFALIGESGSGKSMTALSIMRLLPDGGLIADGSVRFDRRDILALPEVEMRGVRGGAMGMIFQEPATSLNPVLTVGRQIIEVLDRHSILSGVEARRRASALLADVGIPDPARRLEDYPFELSGGMNQRVMIAMALAGSPRLLIADEPTTALDVTIQAQVLDLLAFLQRERGMAMLLISHDLGIVAKLADQVAVMYAGELVEVAPRKTFFRLRRAAVGGAAGRAAGEHQGHRAAAHTSLHGMPLRRSLPQRVAALPCRSAGLAPGRRRPHRALPFVRSRGRASGGTSGPGARAGCRRYPAPRGAAARGHGSDRAVPHPPRPVPAAR